MNEHFNVIRNASERKSLLQSQTRGKKKTSSYARRSCAICGAAICNDITTLARFRCSKNEMTRKVVVSSPVASPVLSRNGANYYTSIKRCQIARKNYSLGLSLATSPNQTYMSDVSFLRSSLMQFIFICDIFKRL